MNRVLEYSVLDVFAERAFAGNPLAVFHDARGLSDTEMQALARETNLAETTFVFPTDEPEDEAREGVRVRIFTTREELPFAGHPTLGTATFLYFNHPVLRGCGTITLCLNVGPITVRFTEPETGERGVRATMLQNDPVFGAEQDRNEVARALGLQLEDVCADVPPQIVSTGNPFCVVALSSLQALKRLAIPQREAQPWLAEAGARFFYCIAPSADRKGWRARMQFYSGEDPATGSAAGCCISWLVKHGLAASGEEVVIHQGQEIGRPSTITVQATLHDGTVNAVLVSGRTIPVAEGRFFLSAEQEICTGEEPGSSTGTQG